MTESKASNFSRKKLVIPFLSALAAMLVGAVVFILPPPLSNQFHATAAGQYQNVSVGPDISIDMNANSAMTVSNSQPPEIELLQGSIYFDIKNKDADTSKLIAIAGNARIKNIGTRFSLQKQKDGGSIAITDGQIEIHIGSQIRVIDAGQQVDFDGTQITEETSIIGANIAPWRQNK
ncbi:MAG: FecR domain-containing protein [Nitrosomonas sp.]|nr:FecR domain-containing protein [Nitrosomonas sp.]MDP1950877.1 FecR domain-containing protein [Nitrosomonas sp.]